MHSKVNKILLICFALSLLVEISIWTINKYMNPNKQLKDKTIAMFLQNEEGTYTESSTKEFPTDGYILNTEKSICRNGGKLSQNPKTKKISLTTSNTDACTLYFDKLILPSPEETLQHLGQTSNGVKNSFTTIATTDEGIFEMEDDYGTSYYYRGAVENNYVKFGKNKSGQDMYWRIVRINGDGSLRIIYDGTSAHANGENNNDRFTHLGKAFNSNPNDVKYIGWMYSPEGTTASTSKEQAQNNVVDSDIKKIVDTWYKENIVDTGYSSSVSDEIFCNDRSFASNNIGTGYGTSSTNYGARERVATDNAPQPNFKCPNQNDAFTVNDTSSGNGDLTYPIGLITADEVVSAGGKFNTSNQNFYLYKGTMYWTLTPSYYSGKPYMHYIYLYGHFNVNFTSNSDISIVPVINLSQDYVKSLIGTGTMTDPYRAP